MAAATVTRYIETGDPNVEVVVLTATDGETFVSRKFGVIHAAQATGNADNDAHINVSYSTATATVNYAGMTDQLVTLTLYGE